MDLTATFAVGGFALLTAGATVSSLHASWSGRSQRKYFDTTGKGPPATPIGVVLALLCCPTATIGAMWYTSVNAEQVLAEVPALFASYGKAVDDVLPIYAKNFTQAFELGFLSEQLKAATDEDVSAILANATALVGRAVRAEELLAVGRTLLEQDNEQSVASKVLSTFSLINFVWFFSTLGLCALLLPFVAVFASPLVTVLTTLFRDVVLPVLIRLKPVYEPLLYCLSLLCMLESGRFARGHDGLSMTGTMLGVTSLGLFGASWLYSTYLHSSDEGDVDSWNGVSGLLLTAASGTLAVLHQSSLLGYVSVACFCGVMGFTAFGTPLTLSIGFDSFEQCARTAGACLFLTLGRAALRAAGVNNMFLRPFASAVDVFGTSVYFLALVILGANERKGKALLWVNLAAYLCLGSVLGMPGLTNTAKVWTSLELFVVYCMHFPKENPDQGVVFMFTVCGILYGASLYLSTHPELILALYSPSSI